MNWREIAKDEKLRFDPYRQNRQNRQNPPCKESFVNSVNIVNRVQTLKKATAKPLKLVEPLLKPCSICGGLDFIHGHKGGFFCTTCQPNARPGVSVRAGGEWS